MADAASAGSRRISVVLSFRNEEDVLPELLRRLQTTLQPLALDYELVFVNDASTDKSLSILTNEARRDGRVKIISMSRRFGVFECLLAGLSYASGDAVVYLDADLQDPPELIPRLVECWEQGADVVHTVRTSRAGEPVVKLFLTDLAYRLINFFSDTELLSQAGDFKLLSRRALTELLRLQERTPYLRGLAVWIGFKQVAVPYQRLARAAGKTKFPLFRGLINDMRTLQGPLGQLVVGLTSFSLLPIMIFPLLGLALLAASWIGSIAWVFLVLAQHSSPYWLGPLCVLALLAGIQLLGIGTLGVYVGRIYQEVRGRPRYVIESSIGFDRKPD